jgi:hypothetical protein
MPPTVKETLDEEIARKLVGKGSSMPLFQIENDKLSPVSQRELSGRKKVADLD